MEWLELMTDGYGRIMQILERTLRGLTPDEMNKQPSGNTNSIGWLAWHLTRVQDDHVADLIGEEQLWIRDGWHVRFNRKADSSDVGWGHTPEQVAAFKSPEADVLLDYHRAVQERTIHYLNSLSSSDLDRELNEPRYQPLPIVGVRLVSVMSDNLQHAGQAAYLRGLLQGIGWGRA